MPVNNGCITNRCAVYGDCVDYLADASNSSVSGRFRGGQGAGRGFWEQLRCPESGEGKRKGIGPFVRSWEHATSGDGGGQGEEPTFILWEVMEAVTLDNPHVLAFLSRRMLIPRPLINVMLRHVLGNLLGGMEATGWVTTLMGQWGEEAVHSWPRCERMTQWVISVIVKRVKQKNRDGKEAEMGREASWEETMDNQFIFNVQVSLRLSTAPIHIL
jgi:hypothetical protein